MIIGLMYAAGTSLCWSVLALFIKKALVFTDSGTIVAFRMLFAFSFLALYYGTKSFKNKATRHEIKSALFPIPWLIILAGGLLSINYWGFVKGVSLSSASHAQITIQTGPLFLFLIGLVYFKEKVFLSQIIGSLLAVLGFVFFYKDQVHLLGSETNVLLGTQWIILAGITWAFFSMIHKIKSKTHSPQIINMIIYFISTIALMSIAPYTKIQTWTLSNWLLLAFLGLNTLVAYGFFGEALKRAPASLVSLIITANPMLTLIFIKLGKVFNIGWIPKEPLGAMGVLGAFCVTLGVIFAVVCKTNFGLKIISKK